MLQQGWEAYRGGVGGFGRRHFWLMHSVGPGHKSIAQVPQLGAECI